MDSLPCSTLNVMLMLAILIRPSGTTISTGGTVISGDCCVLLNGDVNVRCRLILGTSGRLTSSWRQVPVDNFSFIQKDSTGLSVRFGWLLARTVIASYYCIVHILGDGAYSGSTSSLSCVYPSFSIVARIANRFRVVSI